MMFSTTNSPSAVEPLTSVRETRMKELELTVEQLMVCTKPANRNAFPEKIFKVSRTVVRFDTLLRFKVPVIAAPPVRDAVLEADNVPDTEVEARAEVPDTARFPLTVNPANVGVAVILIDCGSWIFAVALCEAAETVTVLSLEVRPAT